MAAKKKAKKAPAKKKVARKPAKKKAPAKKAQKARKAAAAPKKAAAKKAPAKKAAPKAKAPKAPTAGLGRFVWHELTVPNVAQAAAFYGGLFGWTSEDMPMQDGSTYTIFKIGETQVGGAMAPMPGDNSPPHWVPYCGTPDVDACVARAKSAGATVYVEPTDIPNVGRFAVVQDPQGAVLNPFKGAMTQADPSGPPASFTFCWDECLTSDPEASLAFYKKLYGWGSSTTDMGDMGKYYVLLRENGQMAGGIMKLPMPGVPPHWLSHVAVDNLEASLAKAESLGGKALSPITPVPNFGRFAVIADTQGATLGLFQGSQP